MKKIIFAALFSLSFGSHATTVFVPAQASKPSPHYEIVAVTDATHDDFQSEYNAVSGGGFDVVGKHTSFVACEKYPEGKTFDVIDFVGIYDTNEAAISKIAGAIKQAKFGGTVSIAAPINQQLKIADAVRKASGNQNLAVIFRTIEDAKKAGIAIDNGAIFWSPAHPWVSL